MNILFTLCGRAGSKGFKNKNLKSFLDVPLAYYSLAAMKLYKEKYATNDTVTIVLNTDSKELAELVTKQQDAVKVELIDRNSELGGDKVPKVAVILDCLNKMEHENNIKYDVVVDLDITSPLRTVDDIKNAIDQKMKRSDVDVVYSVANSRRNPYFNMVKQEGEFFTKAIPSAFTTRQEAPVFYDMNASIYAYSPKALMEKQHNVFFNDRCYAIVMKDTGILDIDCEEDFELMQIIAKYLFENYPEFALISKEAEKLKESKVK